MAIRFGEGKAVATLAADTIIPCRQTTGDDLKTNPADLKTYMDIPVKATGAEINTGTDDAKFATSKALADSTLGTPEGTAILSTGETGGTKYLREDGDGTCSWQAVAGGGGGAKLIFSKQFEGVLPNGVYPFYTCTEAQTIANVRVTSAGLPVGSDRTYDIRKNGPATTDSIFTSDTPISITTAQAATNGKYTTNGALIDNGVLAANDVLYLVLGGGSTSKTWDDYIAVETA